MNDPTVAIPDALEFPCESPYKRLGVLGGMGPAATVRFFQRIVELTDASCDQEHIDVELLSFGSVPDRTACLEASPENPAFADQLVAMARALEKLGCGVIGMPCNTAHAAADAIENALSRATFLSMIQCAADATRAAGCHRVLVLCTPGTRATGLYEQALAAVDIEACYPDAVGQEVVTDIIYKTVKGAASLPDDEARAVAIAQALNDLALLVGIAAADGADGALAACTELSTLPLATATWPLPLFDALDELARACITACGAPLATA